MSIFTIPFDSQYTSGLSSHRTYIISVLDIGSTKTVCMIGKLFPKKATDLLPGTTHQIEIIGIGCQQSQGVKMGSIVDLDAVERVVRQVVDSAEQMAECIVDSLLVNVSSGHLESSRHYVEMKIGWREVKKSDIHTLIKSSQRYSCGKNRTLLHSMVSDYSLDGKSGIKSPISMFGEKVGVDMHMVAVEKSALRNLEVAINRSHLSVAKMVASPYASGLAVLVDDEFDLGCIVIDMGGGTTKIAVFNEGKLVYTDMIAIGGSHVTNDLARGLSISRENAERLKVMHASVIPSLADEHDILSIPAIVDDDQNNPVQASRAMISRIVRARIEETFELISGRIHKSGFGSLAGKRIVLTGGASQLIGLQEMIRQMVRSNVRIGKPMGIAGLPFSARGAAFSTAIGLMLYPQLVAKEVDCIGEDYSFFRWDKKKIPLLGKWFRKSS
ncbi:cell division protein FtsA [Candidatus Liberibacter solanacearum]|uniref:Cell division protein FtsA n=1 Tax=Candidatus Liberibacter solanacearum TaxID=556287 RepID=A0A094Z1Z8_9HYPH|nr:cell division protein FtsA [Candidatus Liberibacter solanacearum]KGB27662.1 cell division protein FtsA [Candidatus Liberibacter solanacearum]KJZ81208.1 cell division protein FtsA [Candidatus Liberibacter solanacearum]KJZ81678.1 Cell division protein FtsA [Candidatus Liberibacter solanacearum]KQC48944.1 cell division protein FtsA [Candidatus Liberibacter solanacearum]